MAEESLLVLRSKAGSPDSSASCWKSGKVVRPGVEIRQRSSLTTFFCRWWVFVLVFSLKPKHKFPSRLTEGKFHLIPIVILAGRRSDFFYFQIAVVGREILLIRPSDNFFSGGAVPHRPDPENCSRRTDQNEDREPVFWLATDKKLKRRRA